MVLLAVNPGWSGQKFISATLDRLDRLKQKVGDRTLVAVDGGYHSRQRGRSRAKRRRYHCDWQRRIRCKAPLENARRMVGAIQ